MKHTLLATVAAALAATALASSGDAPWDRYRGEMPPPVVPADNPWSEAKFQLGRRLFHDPVLSMDGHTSCASCHIQSLAFADGRRVSPGATGQFTARNSQGLVNAAWHTTLTWANPAVLSIEQQMELPLFGDNPIEMGMGEHNVGAALQRLRDDAGYATAFSEAFGEAADPLTMDNVIKAIASFVRGIVSAESRFDQHQRGELQLEDAELRGKELFFGEKARCHHCHGGFNFNDQVNYAGLTNVAMPFHNTGQYALDDTGAYPEPNRGLFETTGDAADMGAFRAPSLRNVAVTRPYMHDGSVPTLAEVLEIYAAGGRVTELGRRAGDGRQNPHRSELLAGIALTAQDRADLLAFLHTLTDQEVLHSPRFAPPAQQETSP